MLKYQANPNTPFQTSEFIFDLMVAFEDVDIFTQSMLTASGKKIIYKINFEIKPPKGQVHDVGTHFDILEKLRSLSKKYELMLIPWGQSEAMWRHLDGHILY